jgi:hypothetical protein
VTGDESDGAPENLMYLCRSCNTRKGVMQTRHSVGIRTRQYNPQPRPLTFAQFRQQAKVLLGLTPGNVATAGDAIRATPPATRNTYAARIESNPTEAPTFAQYARAVSIHQRGAHDEGGAIIHATPRQLRSQYAERIARIKSERRGEVPF